MNKANKLTIFQFTLLGLIILVVFRMFFLAIRPQPQAGVPLRLVRRGYIYDREQRLLTDNIITHTVTVDKQGLTEQDVYTLVTELAPVLKLTTRELARRLYAQSRFVVVGRRYSDDERERIRSAVSAHNLKGVRIYSERTRRYLFNELAAHIIGFVNVDNKGIEGIEFAYDEYLNPVYTEQDENRHVVLTIDLELQRVLQRELEDTVRATKSVSATAVMLDVNTGDILASSSFPFFDPNQFSRYSYDVIRNRSFMDIIEPGSTFKVFPGALAIEKNVITNGERFYTPGYYEYDDGHRINDSLSNRTVNFEEIFKYSCNYGIITIAHERFTQEEYYRFLSRVGFGRKTGINTIGESSGILRHHTRWSGYSKGYISIGQEIGVTPLQLVNSYAALVNGGYLLTPRIVSHIVDDDGNAVKEFPMRREAVLSDNTVERVTTLLKRGVERGSTGHLARLEETHLIGKTGTAQIAGTGGYREGEYNSIFVGVILDHDIPKIAMAVVVNNPRGEFYSGGKVAAPLFKNIALKSIPFLGIYPRSEEVVISEDAFTDISTFLARNSRSVGENRMPALVGLSFRDALTELDALAVSEGLDVIVSGSGYVESQVPASGAVVSEGGRVYLTLRAPTRVR